MSVSFSPDVALSTPNSVSVIGHSKVRCNFIIASNRAPNLSLSDALCDAKPNFADNAAYFFATSWLWEQLNAITYGKSMLLASPWGTWNCPPNWWAMAWTIPKPALLKESPARHDASCIDMRSCSVAVGLWHFGKYIKTSSIACCANASVKLFAAVAT